MRAALLKCCLFILLCAAAFAELPAQAPQVILSEAVREPPGTYMSGLLWARDDGFVISRGKFRHDGHIWVERYNNKAAAAGVKEYELAYEDKDLSYDECISTRDKL